MKTIIFDKKNYLNYKEFYKDICHKMDASNDLNCLYSEDLGFSGDVLNEFLWDYCLDDINFIFIDFDKEKIKLQKTFDDYKYNIILEVFEDFVKKYPNNKLEFRNDDKNNP